MLAQSHTASHWWSHDLVELGLCEESIRASGQNRNEYRIWGAERLTWLPLSLPYRRGEGQKMFLHGLKTRRVQHSLCDKKSAAVPWDSLTKDLPLSQIQTKLLQPRVLGGTGTPWNSIASWHRIHLPAYIPSLTLILLEKPRRISVMASFLFFFFFDKLLQNGFNILKLSLIETSNSKWAV